MTILRTLIIVFSLFMSSIVMADNYQYLTVAESNGETSFSVSSIQRITFDSTSMNIQMRDGTTQSLPLSSLQKMFFSENTSDIATLDKAKSIIRFAQGILHAEMATGEKVTIFNMKGEQVFSTNESGTYDLSSFVKGVYIVKVGSQTKKVVNK